MRDERFKKVESYFISGALRSRGTQADGQWVGPFECWYESGELLCQFEYRNSQKNGVLREWSKDGVLLLCATL